MSRELMRREEGQVRATRGWKEGFEGGLNKSSHSFMRKYLQTEASSTFDLYLIHLS